jgi:hypothetical protein
MKSIFYSKINWKYKLEKDYFIKTDFRPKKNIASSFSNLQTNGMLMIYKGYAWDGCSGPTYDTNTNMRAGLVHDCLYQLMREGKLTRSGKNRKKTDKLFYKILRKDGMILFRAKYYYFAVRQFAGKYIYPEKVKIYKCP